MSVNCNISAEWSRTAVQTVAKSWYGRKFYLTRDKAIEKDPSLSSFKVKQLPVHLSKRQKKEQTPVPTSQEQYKIFQNVLPSSKAINDFKQNMAIQTEKDAAAALHNKKDNVKWTIHYDLTQIKNLWSLALPYPDIFWRSKVLIPSAIFCLGRQRILWSWS